MSERILIVDDEPLARRSVAREVAATFPDAEVREAKDGFEALSLMRELSPTIVFLDVEMPELSGLDVLRQIEAPRPRIIFVTAYDHFATRAFDENACDYLVKPFTSLRFAQAAERVRAELDGERKLRALERSLDTSGQPLSRLALRLGSRVDLVAVADVSVFISKGHYTYVYSHGREHISELSLVHLEERLDPALFVRVHRNALVNATRIVRILQGPNASVELDDGMRVAVSRRNRATLLERFRTLQE